MSSQEKFNNNGISAAGITRTGKHREKLRHNFDKDGDLVEDDWENQDGEQQWETQRGKQKKETLTIKEHKAKDKAAAEAAKRQ
eukprot:6878280-Ditylum_brightwellii.AAC.1